MKRILQAYTLLVCLTGCGSDSGSTAVVSEDNNTQKIEQSAIELSASTSKKRSSLAADPQDVSLWRESINQLAFSAFALTDNTSNILTSSYQQQVMFAPLYIAASDLTKIELNEAFSFDDATEPYEFLSAFNTLEQQLISTDSYFSQSYLWGQHNYSFAEEYLDRIVEYLGVEVKVADFINDSNLFVDDINMTLSIEDAENFYEYFVDEETKIVSANQSHFTGRWKTPFGLFANEGEFTLLNGSKIKTPLISAIVDVNYYEQDDDIFVELPFEDDEWSLYLLTSRDVDNFTSLKNSISEEKLSLLQGSSALTSIEIIMPTFAFQKNEAINSLDFIDLSILEQALSTALSKYSADFSQLNEGSASDVYVKQAEYTAAIDFNAEGIDYLFQSYQIMNEKIIPENDSNFSGVIIIGNLPSSFIIDNASTPKFISFQQPFIYFLKHKVTGAIILTGHVTDPS